MRYCTVRQLSFKQPVLKKPVHGQLLPGQSVPGPVAGLSLLPWVLLWQAQEQALQSMPSRWTNPFQAMMRRAAKVPQRRNPARAKKTKKSLLQNP